MKKLYVGNLSYGMTEDSVRALFEEHGEVMSVAIITDRETGRSKGFGFVEMSEDTAAQAAMDALDGTEVDGRNIKVNEARPRQDRRGGGGGGRGPRRGGGGGGRW
ncbi:MAG: RNA recognition motif domain-containing protein [Planctomycetota bacterium]|jgi:RNA recognition motif-containing protein